MEECEKEGNFDRQWSVTLEAISPFLELLRGHKSLLSGDIYNTRNILNKAGFDNYCRLTFGSSGCLVHLRILEHKQC